VNTVKGVHLVRRKLLGSPTRWYLYAWRGGPQIAVFVGDRRPKLTLEHLKAITEAAENANAPTPNTFLSVCRQIRSLNPTIRPHSAEWADLSEGTRRVWGYQLDAIEQKWGKTPISVWSSYKMVQIVLAWRDERKGTPRTADLGVQVLKYVLEFARLRSLVKVNVANDIPTLYKGSDRAEIIWTDNDIDRFVRKAIELRRPQMADGIRLAAVTGLRRADLVSLTWSQVGDFAIVKKALKRSARKRLFTTMPRIPELDKLLVELRTRPRNEGVETVLVNSRGEPWSGDGFGGSFNRIRDEAGIIHVDAETGESKSKHLHDIRGTFVTKLCLTTDLSDKEISDIMAWVPERIGNIRRVYVDQSSIVVAIGKRIASGFVKRPVKLSSGGRQK
jgi:integrase